MTFNIQILNNIAKIGLEEFNSKLYKVGEKVKNPDAYLLRSANLHDTLIPSSIQVVGRAGVGVNNIPVAKLTKMGIPVLNTPGANANAVKELVITGLLLACRNICKAWDYTRQIEGDDQALSITVEKNKKRFRGIELPGKTLGIIGLGNIGVKVANAAIQLGMHVIGFDPAITVKHAWQLSASVEQADNLKEVLNKSDFITLHIPLIDKTRHLFGEKQIKSMKKDVVLLNFARDGIIDNQALYSALSEERVLYYVCDFPNNLFKNHPRVLCLPHLGASTKEAEENCAVMVAKQIKAFLESGNINHSVNFPSVKLSQNDGYRLAIVNANVPNMVAQISTVLSNANLNILDMINKSKGEIAYNLVDVNIPITDDVLKSMLTVEGVIHARRINPN